MFCQEIAQWVYFHVNITFLATKEKKTKKRLDLVLPQQRSREATKRHLILRMSSFKRGVCGWWEIST